MTILNREDAIRAADLLREQVIGLHDYILNLVTFSKISIHRLKKNWNVPKSVKQRNNLRYYS